MDPPYGEEKIINIFTPGCDEHGPRFKPGVRGVVASENGQGAHFLQPPLSVFCVSMSYVCRVGFVIHSSEPSIARSVEQARSTPILKLAWGKYKPSTYL